MQIRHARPTDSPELAEIYAPYCQTPISFEIQAPGADEMATRVRQAGLTHPWLVAEQSGRLLGYAYASLHRARAAYRYTTETSVYLRPEAQGRGLGSRLYLRLLDILCRQGYHLALAGLTMPNPGSLRLHHKLGFQSLGTYPEIGYKAQSWHSVHWLSRQLSQQTPPDEVLLLSQIGEGEWDLSPLITLRLKLCPLAPGDESDLLSFVQSEAPRLQPSFPLLVADVTNLAQSRRFVRQNAIDRVHRTSYSFAVRDLQGGWVGYLSLKHFDWSVPKADMGYCLANGYQGQGLMTEAVQAATRFGLDQLNLKRLYLRIHPDNLASQKVAQNCGFQFEGRLRNEFRSGQQCHDMLIFSTVP